MYYGRYYHKVESKNRLSIPTIFRKHLNREAILTRGLDGCLFLFDLPTWEKRLAEAQSLSYTKRAHRDFIRLMTNTAVSVEIDAHGRVLLPELLKEQAGLVRDVVVVGSLDRIEIWDQSAYHTYVKTIDETAEEIAEGITFFDRKKE